MEKKRLPNRRSGYTQKAVIGGQTIYLRTGEYQDGTLGEIFCDLSKEGSLIRSMMNSFCIAISVALQYGASLEDLGDKYLHSRFEPSGVVQNHPYIKMASSMPDLIFRDLLVHYCGREDLKHGAKTEAETVK